MIAHPEEDFWISSTSVANFPLSSLEDCSIAVHATYFMQLVLCRKPFDEPLLPALGGLTGFYQAVEESLEQWAAHAITPLFIFDGQFVSGQSDITLGRSLRANDKTNRAWEIYFGGRADEAVLAFGEDKCAFRPETLYPLLQGILRQRGLHFLVAPFAATAQMAYLDMIDSDQCAGIMGPLELLLYPIHDCVIRSLEWQSNSVVAVSKKQLLKVAAITEDFFIDAFLMKGTSFLATFPPLRDQNIIKPQPANLGDAFNMLRTAKKSVVEACSSFNDVLVQYDPDWLDKYRRARMAVMHFIYISESGQVQTHHPATLTRDSHEYLGLQLPAELFHYLNTGLIGPAVLNWITYSQLQVFPTIDGFASDEYKNLVEKQLTPIRETTLGLLIPRLHRVFHYKPVTLKVWYDNKATRQVWDKITDVSPKLSQQVISWHVDEALLSKTWPKFAHGTVWAEIQALENADFAAKTITSAKDKDKKQHIRIQSKETIQSICLWRFLHLRGYVDDKHTLTKWGKALAETMKALRASPVADIKLPRDSPTLYDSAVIAFEMIRFGLLNAKNRHDGLSGYPIKGTAEERDSLLLLSRCSTLLKLRHATNGYTGPLSKSLLAFRSLTTETRAANRDLLEGLLANMFLYGQAQRRRDDCWELSHELPFLITPDIALGIAVKTYFDDIDPSDNKEEKARKMANFMNSYMPFALAFVDDLEIALAFFAALHAGVKTLDSPGEMKADERAIWDATAKYIDARR